MSRLSAKLCEADDEMAHMMKIAAINQRTMELVSRNASTPKLVDGTHQTAKDVLKTQEMSPEGQTSSDDDDDDDRQKKMAWLAFVLGLGQGGENKFSSTRDDSPEGTAEEEGASKERLKAFKLHLVKRVPDLDDDDDDVVDLSKSKEYFTGLSKDIAKEELDRLRALSDELGMVPKDTCKCPFHGEGEECEDLCEYIRRRITHGYGHEESFDRNGDDITAISGLFDMPPPASHEKMMNAWQMLMVAEQYGLIDIRLPEKSIYAMSVEEIARDVAMIQSDPKLLRQCPMHPDEKPSPAWLCARRFLAREWFDSYRDLTSEQEKILRRHDQTVLEQARVAEERERERDEKETGNAYSNLDEMMYLDTVQRIISTGDLVHNHANVSTLSSFGTQLRFDLQRCDSKGKPVVVIPLLTTKRVFWRGVVKELLWFIGGCVDVNKPAAKNGIGKRGWQWRHVCTDSSGEGVDQLAWVIEQVKHNSTSRQIVMTAWNAADVDKTTPPPCHVVAQWIVRAGKLSCILTQRQADMALSVPFNMASYALLTAMIAHLTALQCGELIMNFGDAHVYTSHVRAFKKQLKRETKEFPTLRITEAVADIDSFIMEHFELRDYHPGRPIKLAAV